MVTGSSNPDAARQKKRQPQGLYSSSGTRHSPAVPPSQMGIPPPSSSGNTALQPKQAPPHPWPPAPLAPGVDPKSPRTANKAYDTVVAVMLTEAQHKFECLLFVEDAYPGIDTQIRWSFTCWEAICVDTKRYYELSKEMMNLVRDHTMAYH